MMKCGRAAMLVCLALAFAVVAEASVLKENKRISPRLQPESSKEFDKGFPGDKRPKVDVLHFKHPYPVVQDSEDFDKDFVQDENTDNGEWKAQSEYDRLRIKLAKLKEKAAGALTKKQQEKRELDGAMQKRENVIAKDQAEISKKSKEVEEPVKPVKPMKPVKPARPVTPAKVVKKEPEKVQPKEEVKVVKKKEEKKEEGAWWPWPWSWPKDSKKEWPKQQTQKTTPAPKPKPAPVTVDTSGAAKAVEQAMKNLEDCESELAAAKAELKKLMDELEKSKIKQVEAREGLNQAKIKQSEAEKHEGTLKTKYTAETKDYAEAKAAYLKQKAVYEKSHRELVAAAAKVKAMRDSEDKGGGVYPTTRSAASSISSTQLLGLIVSVVAIGQL